MRRYTFRPKTILTKLLSISDLEGNLGDVVGIHLVGETNLKLTRIYHFSVDKHHLKKFNVAPTLIMERIQGKVSETHLTVFFVFFNG